LSSRVAYHRFLGKPNRGSTGLGCDGHGNLNAHIVAGYNDFLGFPHTDAEGYRYGLGIAPFVRVGSSVVFDPWFWTFPNYTEIQARAYEDRARVSCNSWGANAPGLYTNDCQEYDALVRDAQPDVSPFPMAGNQEMVIVFAAGNAGPRSRTVGIPASAKNVIAVGAAENVHPHSKASGGEDIAGGDGCGLGDSEADNANEMAWFSSRGPCADGRVKPDLVGPGTHVTGGVAQQSNPSANGTALSCFDGSQTCALLFGRFFPIGQELYTTSSGTSHSCPAVGGGAALLRQYFLNRSWSAESGDDQGVVDELGPLPDRGERGGHAAL
jgi:subtilisin family serine protease